MMKNFCRVIFLMLLSSWAYGQGKTFSLTGTIIVGNTDTIPYKLVLKEKNGEISGYSLTYTEPYETRTKITGTLDRSGHILAFKETDIDYIHGYHSGPSLCLIEASLYDLSNSYGTVLMGSVKSSEADHTACGTAKVVFKNRHEVEALFAFHDQFDTVINMKDRAKSIPAPQASPQMTEPVPQIPTEKITTGIEKYYDWHSDTVVVEVWDGGYIDGDKVTLIFNGDKIAGGYTLAKEKKEYRLPLAAGINTLVIHADNEGSDPPNTATLQLIDGKTIYNVVAYNKKGDEAIVKMRQVKK